MKKIALAFCGLVLIVAGCAQQQASFAGYKFMPILREHEALWNGGPKADHFIHNKGIVRAIQGNAEISNDDGQNWIPAEIGAHLGAGGIIRTAPKDGVVDIFLGENGPVIRLKAGSLARIDRLDIENSGIEKVIVTRIELQRGHLLGSVKKLAAASSYLVRTPTSLVQVRGTEFSVSAESAVNVASGSARVYYKGEWVEVNAGTQFSPPEGMRTKGAAK